MHSLPELPPKLNESVVPNATCAEPEYDTSTSEGYTKLQKDLQWLVGCDCHAVGVRFNNGKGIEPVFNTYRAYMDPIRDIIMHDLVRGSIINNIHKAILVWFNRREQAGSIYIYLMSGKHLTVVDAQYDPVANRCKVITHGYTEEEKANM